MKISLAALFWALLSLPALAISPEEAESRLVLVKFDQATKDAVGVASDGGTNRKAFAKLLGILREAQVNGVFLDYVYSKREVPEDNLLIAEEFKKYNREGGPLLQICNGAVLGEEDEAEEFVAHARLGICGHMGTETVEAEEGSRKQNSLVATYCRPIMNDMSRRYIALVSADPADATFAQNATCDKNNFDPAAMMLEHLGLKIDLARYNRTAVIDKGASIGKGLEITYVEHAPVEYSMIDVLSGKISAEQLKGKVIMVGTTVPGRDIVRMQSKEQHGVYTYVSTFLALLNDKHRELSRESVDKEKRP